MLYNSVWLTGWSSRWHYCISKRLGRYEGSSLYSRQTETERRSGALATLVQDPYARPERVLLLTTHCVVAYDLYPKARVHVILPRYQSMDAICDPRTNH